MLALDPRAERAEKLREQRGTTYAWIADQLGLSRQAVRYWLTGEREPRDVRVLDQIIRLLEGGAVREASAAYGRPDTMVPMPVLRVAAAGDDSSGEVRDEILVPIAFMYPDYRCLLIEGESMFPHLQPGDVAVFREWSAPKLGFVNAIQSGSDLFVKVVEFDGTYRLHSFNPSVDVKDAPPGAQALGYLVGLYRDDGVESSYRHNRGGLRF